MKNVCCILFLLAASARGGPPALPLPKGAFITNTSGTINFFYL
jgi:hypothetical protein